jgi:hypothetical protein
MATATILQLPQAQSLTGAEAVEMVQNGQSVRGTSAQVASLGASVSPTGPTGVVEALPNVGANNDYAPPGFGATTGFLEVTPVGVTNLTGLLAGYDGQLVTITNLSAYQLTLNALNSGSQTANQFRMVADAVLDQYNGKSFKYSATIGCWVAI